jgi:hypothetical protein
MNWQGDEKIFARTPAAALVITAAGKNLSHGKSGITNSYAAALLLLMLGARTTVTPFHHQPEAQHPKSRSIHNNAGRSPHISGGKADIFYRRPRGAGAAAAGGPDGFTLQKLMLARACTHSWKVLNSQSQ